MGSTSVASPARARIGVQGLDEILRGGLTPHRLYLVEGLPGTGKTTLALQFLLEGVRAGERVLYVTLSETEAELREVAESHGWSLEGVLVRDIAPSTRDLQPDEQYTMFHPSEVELGETTRAILEDVERHRPSRVVFDSLSEFRLLAGNPLRYRRQVLALKQFFVGRKCTVLLLDDLPNSQQDLQVRSIAHGVIHLEQLVPEFGGERRRLNVPKYRGVAFRGGYHDYVIRRGGLQVFPRLTAGTASPNVLRERFSSGIPQVDALLGGGVECGTSTLLVGAAGVGKSSLAMQFVHAAAQAGHPAAIFMFDESVATMVTRCAGLGMDLKPHIASGRVRLHHIDPAEMAPGEFACTVTQEVERRGARVIVIDSLNGYLNAMPEERYLTIQLHELLTYLGNAGVATLLVGAHQGLVGGQMVTPVDASYLADAVVLLRYYESRGELRQAISVVKKRGSEHERTIRDFQMAGGRISVGEPLRKFRGVLTGVPTADAEPVAAGLRQA
jgi:circadian clock protein KaiC